MTEDNVANPDKKTVGDLAFDDMVTKVLQTDWSFVQRLVRNAMSDVEGDADCTQELGYLSRSALWCVLEDLMDAEQALEKIEKFQQKFDMTQTENGDD